MPCSAKAGRDSLAAKLSRHGVADYIAEHPIVSRYRRVDQHLPQPPVAGRELRLALQYPEGAAV